MAQKRLAKQLASFLRKKRGDITFQRFSGKTSISDSTLCASLKWGSRTPLSKPLNVLLTDKVFDIGIVCVQMWDSILESERFKLNSKGWGFCWIICLVLAFLVSTGKAEMSVSEYQNATDTIASNLEVLIKSGKYAEAIPLASEWLTNEVAICKQGYDPTGEPQYYLGEAYFKLGNMTNAVSELQVSLPLMEKSVGPDNTYTCLARCFLGSAYTSLGDYSRAQGFLEQNVKIIENTKSTNGSGLSLALMQLALNESKLPDFTNSSLHYHRALKIREDRYGTDDDRTIETASDLACLDMQDGDFAESKTLYDRVIQAMTINGQTNTLRFSEILNDCGSLYDSGFQDQARAGLFFAEAKNVYESCDEKNDGLYSEILLNVGNLEAKLGDYQKAEKCFSKALGLAENVYGKDGPEIIVYLIRQSGLFILMGNTDESTAILLRAVDIMHKSELKEDQETALLYRNIAAVNEMTKNYKSAEQFLLLAIKIYDNVFGPNHPDTLMIKRDLGHLYAVTDQNEKAEPIFSDILKSYQEHYGADDNIVPLVRVDLAVIYQESGDYTKAIDQFKLAKETYEKSFGLDYNRIAAIESGWATCELALNHKPDALVHARNERRISELFLNRLLAFTSESERLSYVRRERISCDALCSIGKAQDIGEALIRNKGIVLDSFMEDKNMAQILLNPKLMPPLNRLHNLNLGLDTLDIGNSYQSNSKMFVTHQQDRNAEAKNIEETQRTLAEYVASSRETRRAFRTTISDVQSILSSNTVLLEFVRYFDITNPKSIESRYGVAYIGNTNFCFSGLQQGEPGWISLGGADAIEECLKQYGQMMRSRDRGDAVVLKTLYSELMAPVIKQLPTNVTSLIVCPDAKLDFLSFATLVDQKDRFLAESYRIKYVASGRDLVYGRKATNANPELAVFADPSFNAIPGIMHLIDTNAVNVAMLSTDRRDYNGCSLPQLPNTAQESEYLQAKSSSWHLKPATFTGTEATEAQVKALHSPYILHLATHGFFLPDIQPTNQTRTLQYDQKMPVVLHNPMQRSGLALAGAELTLDAWKRGEVPDTENDGILMADEVALLDLQNTWLVTLSACDTGIGEARAGEGVLGLRRGFIQAGAQNLLMTLWPVSDKWTVDLMKGFYDEAMRTGNAPDALADVQREYLVKLKKEKNLVFAARLAGPFVMNFQGKP